MTIKSMNIDFLPERKYHLISISAPSADSLALQTKEFIKFLFQEPKSTVKDLSYTLHCYRNKFKYSKHLVVSTREELKEVLKINLKEENIIQHLPSNTPLYFIIGSNLQSSVILLADLYKSEPLFRFNIEQCIQYFEEAHLNITLKQLLTSHPLEMPILKLIRNFITTYALGKLYLDLGITPNGLIGVGIIGELAAAVLSSVLKFKDALNLVSFLSQYSKFSSPHKTLFVNINDSLLKSYLKNYKFVFLETLDENNYVIEVTNQKDIAKIKEVFKKNNIFYHELKTEFLYYKDLPDHVLNKWISLIKSLPQYKQELSLITREGPLDPSNECSNSPFLEDIENQYSHLYQKFAFILHKNQHKAIICSLLEEEPSQLFCASYKDLRSPYTLMISGGYDALKALGKLWGYGVFVDWPKFYNKSYRKTIAPKFVFNKTNHWLGKTKTLASSSDRPPTTSHTPNDSFTPELINKYVTTAWKKALGGNPTGKEDFFEAGGDSLSAVQFREDLKKGLGITLDIARLEHTSFKNILLAVEKLYSDQKRSMIDSPIITLQSGNPGVYRPIILIHPIGGDVYFYRFLVRELPKEQPVYAIQSPLLHGKTSGDSIQKIATFYIREIENHGINYPFILGGASYGGIIAYEIGQQIKSKQQVDPKLILIDSPAYTALPSNMDALMILKYLLKYGPVNFSISQASVENFTELDNLISFIEAKAYGTEYQPLFTRDFLTKYIRTWLSHSLTMHKYIPEPYTGTIVYFSHTETIPEFPDNQEQHWEKLSYGQFFHYKIPGNHLTMNAPPHIEILSKNLKSHLECIN